MIVPSTQHSNVGNITAEPISKGSFDLFLIGLSTARMMLKFIDNNYFIQVIVSSLARAKSTNSQTAESKAICIV